jgi:hypothetical protein
MVINRTLGNVRLSVVFAAGRQRVLNMDDLDGFYELVRGRTRVDQFLRCYDALSTFVHSNGLTPDYRLGKGRLKRLRDEVTPAACFVRQHAAPVDEIQFPLNSNVPDCHVWHRDPERHRTIEITVVQGRERFNLMTELNSCGLARGFIGLTDDKPTGEFLDAMRAPLDERPMYSTDAAQEIMAHAITLCARNKLHSKGDTLIIEAELLALPRIRWQETQSRLAQLTVLLSFSEIFLIGYHDDGDLCLQLK